MLSLQQTFKKFDFFGQFITLNMNKSNCYTTGLGGLSSILIIIFLGVFFYSNIVQFVTKQKANAKTQTQFNIDPDLIILNSTNFMTAFSIDQVNFTSRPLFNITLEQKFYHRQPNGTITKTITTFDLQPCQLEQFTTKVKDGNTTMVEQQFQMLGMSNWLCPKDDFNFNLQGAYGSLDFSFVKITVKDCVNDTRTGWNPLCASEEDHQKIFKKDGSFKLQVYSINTVVNPGLPDNYLQIYLDSDLYFTFVPKQFLNTANIYYRQYQLYNDDSISPFKEVNQENIILRTSEDFRDLSIIGQSTSTNYAEIFLRRSQMNAKIERNYQQIGELLSYIGGFMQITKLIFGFFIAFYNRTSLLIELSNKLYDFKEGYNKLCSSPTISQRTPKYIQDTFRQKGFLESQNINSEDLRKRQSTVIKKNVLQKLIKKSEPIRFSVKLLLNQITCGMFFNERNSIYLRKAIDKMNEDLDLHSILFKINEISKLKEVLFNDSQIILFNFTPKPIIALKNDQMLPTRMNFEDEEQPHMARLKHSQSRIDNHIYNKIYSAYIDLLEGLEDPDLPQWQYEQDLKLIHLLGSDITKIFSEQFQLEQPRGYIIKDSKESCKSLAKKLDTERQDGKLV